MIRKFNIRMKHQPSYSVTQMPAIMNTYITKLNG